MMRTRCLTRVLGSIIACLLCFVGLSTAWAADVKTEDSLWEQAGIHPSTAGIEIEADNLLDDTGSERKSSLTRKQFFTAVRLRDENPDECTADYYLQDDLWCKTTFTVPGEAGPVHKAKWLKVAFKKSKGGVSLPKEHADRWAVRCPSGNEDGYDVYWPKACGQPTICKNVFSKQEVTSSEPQKDLCDCRDNPSHTEYEGRSSSGYYESGNCPTHYSGSKSNRFVDGGPGTTCHCE